MAIIFYFVLCIFYFTVLISRIRIIFHQNIILFSNIILMICWKAFRNPCCFIMATRYYFISTFSSGQNHSSEHKFALMTFPLCCREERSIRMPTTFSKRWPINTTLPLSCWMARQPVTWPRANLMTLNLCYRRP